MSEGFLQTPEGLKLFYRQWPAQPPRAACILVHGLGEHGGRYAEFVEQLRNRSFSIWAMDHRGHGRSEGLRGDCRTFSELVEDLRRFVGVVEEASGSLPRFLIGHSLGGLMALEFAAAYPQLLRAVVVSAPVLELAKPPPLPKQALAHTLARLLPTTAIPNGVDPKLISRDPQVVREYETDPLICRVLTARCAVALQRAIRRAPALAKQIRLPCLILQGTGDQICSPEGARAFAQQVPDGKVTFRTYPGLYHELFHEPERHRIYDEVCQWLEERLRDR